MAKKHPWAREWQIYKGQPPGGKYLAPVRFTLMPVRYRRLSGAAFYRVTRVKPKKMQRHWQNIRLFPRGSKTSYKVKKLLPRWTQKCDAEWNDAATTLRGKFARPNGCFPGIDPTVQRLEGDMHPRGKPEALTIVRVESAVIDTSELLVVILKSLRKKELNGYSTLEDGTAHGGVPH